MRLLPLVLRNLRRNRLRTVLTIVSTGLAIALVCMLLSMPAGFDAMTTALASNTRVGTHAREGTSYSLPYAYLERIRSLPGIVGATSYTFFSGVLESQTVTTIPSFAVDPDSIGAVMADYGIDATALADFVARRDGALVGSQTLDRQGWKPGDRFTLKGRRFPVTLPFRVIGGLGESAVPSVFFHREYLVQALAARGLTLDTTDLVWSRVDDPERVDATIQAIDAMFRNSAAQTTTETEKAFVSSFFGFLDSLVAVILIVTLAVALCVVAITANTASMSIRERLGELAILKALGFRRRAILLLALGETVLIAMVGGVLGAGASFVLTAVTRSMSAGWNAQLALLGSFQVTAAIVAQALLLAFAVGVASGLVPALSASRRGVVETLREVF